MFSLCAAALFAFLLVLTGMVSAPPARAADLISSRAVLEDRSGTLTIADVADRQADFKPVGPTLSKGFSKSAYWLRLQVKPPARGNEVVLLIRQPFLNEIRLYEADAGSPQGWKSRVTGNLYPFSQRERARQTLGFVITPKSSEAIWYLRLKTATQVQMSVEALEPAEAERLDNRFDLMELFFVTSMLLLLLWALHSYLLDRLPVVRLFALHQAAYTLFGVAVTGYLAPFLPVGHPNLVNLSTAIPYCTVAFTTLLFCRELFRPYQPPPFLMRGLNLFLLLFPLQLVAMLLGYTSVAVMVNAVLIKVSWWYFVVMTFTFRKEQSPSRRLLQIFFLVITIIFTLFWYLGSSSAGANINIGRQILIANGLIIGGLFAMILNARSRRLQQEAQKSALDLQARSEFLALVSHEIRTPLNALAGFSSLARSTSDPVKREQYHDILEESSRLLMELVNNILDMSKIEAGGMVLETAPFNLRQLVNSLEEQYRHLAEQKGLAFQLVIHDTVSVWVLGDPLRLRQVLSNLLSNAVKFTGQGEVTCRVSQTGSEAAPSIRFEIQDTGIGIPDNNRDQLFEPFRQLDPGTSRRYGGTGLGLAIVHSLVGMMGGQLTLESKAGAGSCFVVELPCKETEPVQAEQATPPLMLPHGTVLVVEDNSFNRRLLEDLLVSWGQQVTLAENGFQALSIIEQQPFDLILLDIRMPGIDGIELAGQLRQRELERNETPVPIIAITADTDLTTRQACLSAGINAVLPKPVMPDQLAEIVAKQLMRPETTPAGNNVLLNLKTSNDLGSDTERLRQYQELLIQDIDEELLSLQTALHNDDRTELVRSAHTLKGLCGHLASHEPMALAGWLQQNATVAASEQIRSVVQQLVRHPAIIKCAK